jgi:hypothetical protein
MEREGGGMEGGRERDCRRSSVHCHADHPAGPKGKGPANEKERRAGGARRVQRLDVGGVVVSIPSKRAC